MQIHVSSRFIFRKRRGDSSFSCQKPEYGSRGNMEVITFIVLTEEVTMSCTNKNINWFPLFNNEMTLKTHGRQNFPNAPLSMGTCLSPLCRVWKIIYAIQYSSRLLCNAESTPLTRKGAKRSRLNSRLPLQEFRIPPLFPSPFFVCRRIA